MYLCEEMTLSGLYPKATWHSMAESLLVTTEKSLPSNTPGIDLQKDKLHPTITQSGYTLEIQLY